MKSTQSISQIAKEYNINLKSTTFKQFHAQLPVEDRAKDLQSLLNDGQVRQQIQQDGASKIAIEGLIKQCPACANIPEPIPGNDLLAKVGPYRNPNINISDPGDRNGDQVKDELSELNNELGQVLEKVVGCQKGYYASYLLAEANKNLDGATKLRTRIAVLHDLVVKEKAACPY
jgi:hypothetical protein